MTDNLPQDSELQKKLVEEEQVLKQLSHLENLSQRRIKENGIAYYEPNPWQYEAHCSEARIIIACFGNRAGKTSMGAAEIAYHVTGQYPAWYPESKRFHRPVSAVIVGTKYDIIDRVIEPKLRQMLPLGFYHLYKTAHRHLNRIECKNGSTIDILTNEMDTMSFESAAWDIYWGDEPQEKPKYEALLRGLLDRNGRAVLTFTPLIQPWMKDDLMDKEDGKLIKVFTGSTYDNQFTKSGKPILNLDQIKWLEDQLDEEMREVRIQGRFFHLKGMVYKTYNSLVHEYTESGYHYPDPVICVLDPHDRQKHHAIWAYIDRTDDIYVDDELVMNGTVSELARAILYREQSRSYCLSKRLIDPNFGRKPLITTGRTVIEELGKAGCPGWSESDDAVEEGHMKVREYLKYNFKKPIDINNRPKLYFNRSRCPATIHSIRNLQYDEWRGSTDRDPKEQEKKKDAHGADTVRYLCMSNPTYERMTYASERFELAEAPY